MKQKANIFPKGVFEAKKNHIAILMYRLKCRKIVQRLKKKIFGNETALFKNFFCSTPITERQKILQLKVNEYYDL